MGVWIEIHPPTPFVQDLSVAPFVGVWIEMVCGMGNVQGIHVAPFVGVWIEMQASEEEMTEGMMKSLPLWECGLKCKRCIFCTNF